MVHRRMLLIPLLISVSSAIRSQSSREGHVRKPQAQADSNVSGKRLIQVKGMAQFVRLEGKVHVPPVIAQAAVTTEGALNFKDSSVWVDVDAHAEPRIGLQLDHTVYDVDQNMSSKLIASARNETLQRPNASRKFLVGQSLSRVKGGKDLNPEESTSTDEEYDRFEIGDDDNDDNDYGMDDDDAGDADVRAADDAVDAAELQSSNDDVQVQHSSGEVLFRDLASDGNLSALGRRLVAAFVHRDLAGLKLELQRIDRSLWQSTWDAQRFDPNSFMVPLDGRDLPLLSFGSKFGWLAGVSALVNWDLKRTDTQVRLHIDMADTVGSTALLQAVQGGHAPVVRHLVWARASPFANDLQGQTALEIAASHGMASVAEALLTGRASELRAGLAPLRIRMATKVLSLPRGPKRLLGRSSTDGMDSLRELIPSTLQPHGTALEMVGNRPSDWLLHYKNRVMRAYLKGLQQRHRNQKLFKIVERDRMGPLLVAHDYDSFASEFSWIVVSLSLCLLFFGLLAYVAFRFRVFGTWESPIPLAFMLPGAFDPLRFADPDFDPERMPKHRLLYKGIAAHASDSGVETWKDAPADFLKALLGVFQSWLFLSVRIPLERDTHDEDYGDEDDVDARTNVRLVCAQQAWRLRSAEVVLRILLLVTLYVWFFVYAQRLREVLLLTCVCFQASFCAACLAASARLPQGKSGYEGKEGDVAQLICALFFVQYGPRWGRSSPSVRSTASKSSVSQRAFGRRRKRKRSLAQQDALPGVDADISAVEDLDAKITNVITGNAVATFPINRMAKVGNLRAKLIDLQGTDYTLAKLVNARGVMLLDDDNIASIKRKEAVYAASLDGGTSPCVFIVEVTETSGTTSGGDADDSGADAQHDSPGASVEPLAAWQWTLAKAGVLDTTHGAFLQGAVSMQAYIVVALLWMLHLRPLLLGCGIGWLHRDLEAHELFDVYGGPGSGRRFFAVCLELLLLAVVAERLYAIASVLHVAGLSLWQRQRALAFAAKQKLPAESGQPSGEAVLRQLTCRARRWEFAAELSSLRWNVLRVPVLVVLLGVGKFLTIAAVCTWMGRVPSLGFDPLILAGYAVDADVLLYVGDCLAWPCLVLLVAGACANLETDRERQRIRDDIDAQVAALETSQGLSQQSAKQLHLEARNALKSCFICWPGGRSLGFLEPMVLSSLLLANGCLAVVSATLDRA